MSSNQLKNLNSQHRYEYVIRYWNEKSNKELAEELGVTESAISWIGIKARRNGIKLKTKKLDRVNWNSLRKRYSDNQ